MAFNLPDLSLSTTIPCANCALPIDLPIARSIYCSELCNQVARAVRYIRNRERDGRIDQPDIAEAIRTQLAFIPTGGYPTKLRRIDPATRQAVVERDEGRCRKCGGVGTEIDHIATSRSDLSNLQLLCHECHMEKTQSSFVPASPEVAKAVFAPIFARAASNPPRQPSDSSEWQHTQWRRNAQTVPATLRNWWAAGIRYAFPDDEDDGAPDRSPITNPVIAAAGFLEQWEPWTWYEGS
jgi:5-methylcytosine-specific restriction endonuclease McrA